MDETCPYCNEELDLSMGWDDVDEDGDVVTARARIECPHCGATLNVTAHFHWDGCYEID